jgi:replicative DNA helicase
MGNFIQYPKAVECEKSALGAALVDGGAASVVCTSLGDPDFMDPRNKLVFQAMSRLFAAKKPIDPATVTDDLSAAHTIDDAGGPDYLLELGESCISTDQTSFYVKQIKSFSVLRGYLTTVSGVLRRFSDERPTDPLGFIAETAPEIADSASKGASEGFESSKAIADKVRADIDAEALSGRRGLTGLDTGFAKLNEYTHGWQAGDLAIVAGRPSMGKTAFAANLAWSAAKKGKTVAFFSFEMRSDQIVRRMVSMVSTVRAERIQSGCLSQGELRLVDAAVHEIGRADIRFDDASSGALADVVADSDRLRVSCPELGLIIVDYIGLMSAPRQESRQVEVAFISRSLKRMARALNVPVIALCQLNRESEGNEGSFPSMANLRESGAIEQDADLVILLHRQSYYESRKKGSEEPEISVENVIVAKNRNGRSGAVDLMFDRGCQRFADPATRDEAANAPRNDRKDGIGPED